MWEHVHHAKKSRYESIQFSEPDKVLSILPVTSDDHMVMIGDIVIGTWSIEMVSLIFYLLVLIILQM